MIIQLQLMLGQPIKIEFKLIAVKRFNYYFKKSYQFLPAHNFVNSFFPLKQKISL